MSSKSKEDLEIKDPSIPPAGGSGLVVVEEQETKTPSMPAVPEGHSLSLIEMAVRRGDSLEMVSKLMDLQDRHDAKQAKMAFVQAMSNFKSEHLQIRKNKQVGYEHRDGGGSTNYAYSTLDNILEVAVPVMSQYGLSATWDLKQDNGSVIVTCTLCHNLGHSESVTMQAAPDKSGKKNPIQEVASTVTYLERYTFLAITGLSVGDIDDDGRRGGGSKTLPDEEKTKLIAEINGCTTIKQLEKVGAKAAKACNEYNDLQSHNEIKKEYASIKHLIENPPE